MNNIQKNFKAKRGLCMAQGGLIDQLDPSGQMSRLDLGTLTNDPTVLNAAMAREGLAAEQARQAKYPGQTFMNPVAQPQRQAAPQQAAQLQPQQPLDKFREPAPTSFEQDNNARGLRIQGYGDQLAGMRKERLGLADGTANLTQASQPESAEQVMARMAAKYGVSAQPTAAPVQAPQPVQQAPQPAPQRQGLMGAAMGLIGGRKAAIDRAVGYAEGGIVRGKGGPTDDEVPMQVAGKDVNLSNSEAVLPVKTVQALGGPEAVEELIEETNGKPPVRGGLRAGGAYEGGTGGWSLGSGQKPTIYDNGGLPAQVVQAGVDTMRGQLADTRDPRRMSSGAIREVGADLGAAKEDPEALMQRVAKTHGLEYQTPAAVPTVRGQDTPTDPDTDGRRTYSPGYGKSFVKRGLQTGMVDGPGAGIFKMPVFDKAGGDKELAAARANGRFDNSPERSLVDNTLGKGAAVPQGLRNRWADNDPMKAQQYMSKDNAASGLRNNPADGHGVVSIKQADGKFKNVLMSPSQYTGADGKPTSDWSKTAQFAQGTAQAAKDKASLRDIEYSNAKFNATSDQITDPNARAAGLRGLAQYDIEEKASTDKAVAAAKAQHDNMQLQLTKRGQDITLAGHENMQKNTESAARATRDKDRRSRAKDLLDMHATRADKDGKPVMDPTIRAELEQAYLGAVGGKMMGLQDEGPDGYEALSSQALDQARLSTYVRAAMRKDKAGWNFNNVGKDANTTLKAAEMTYDPKTGMLDVGGYKVKGKDVWGDDMDLKALVETRKKKAN